MERDVQEDVKEILYLAESGFTGVPLQPMHPAPGTIEQRVGHLELVVAAQKDAILLLAAKLDELRGSGE
jgi:hypothetical protein